MDNDTDHTIPEFEKNEAFMAWLNRRFPEDRVLHADPSFHAGWRGIPVTYILAMFSLFTELQRVSRNLSDARW